jgi:hypothetical protein
MTFATREPSAFDDFVSVFASLPEWVWLVFALLTLAVVMIQVAGKRLTRDKFRDPDEHSP